MQTIIEMWRISSDEYHVFERDVPLGATRTLVRTSSMSEALYVVECWERGQRGESLHGLDRDDIDWECYRV